MDEPTVRALHSRVLQAWNGCDADAMAACFAPQALLVGFDGSQLTGRDAIRAEMGRIFRDHTPGRFVAVVRGVRQVAANAWLLHAVAGMAPGGGATLDERLSAVQTLLACPAKDGTPQAELFQNTPAQLHGRPEEASALARELQALL